MIENNIILEKITPKNGFIQLVLNKSLLGGSDAIEFQKEINNILDSKNLEVIILDLVNVEQINSSGLGMLVASNSNILKNKKKLVLINLSAKVQELVKMTHLDKVLNISQNLDSAL